MNIDADMPVNQGPGSRHESVYLAFVCAGDEGATCLEVGRRAHLPGADVRVRLGMLRKAGLVERLPGPMPDDDPATRWRAP